MAPLNSTYQKNVSITNLDYTIKFGDDQITFTIASGQTATLPAAGTCTPMSLQNVKRIINSANSGGTLTISAPSGNSLIGIGSLAAGQETIVTSDGTATWTGFGGGGQAGTSGYSGPSGYSGFTGVSGYTGFTGISGYTGFSGYSGFSGYTGFSGASGYSGYSGVSGYSGFSGKSGYTGFSG